MAQPTPPTTFVYQSQSADGNLFAGTLDAPTIADASRQLQSLGLRVTRLQPSEKRSAAAAPFRADDFLAFNQQLASLTAGGLPIERSLRLVATELHDKRHTAALQRIAGELEKGTPLAAAFATEQASFPPLYANLLEAGVKSSNLPAMLLNLGRHVQMLQRLRSAWWRSASYPLTVLCALLLVMGFIWTLVLPQFAPLAAGAIFRQDRWGSRMPTGQTGVEPAVRWALTFANVVGYGVMGIIAVFLLTVLFLWILGRTSKGWERVQKVVLPLPLIGPILRWNLVARWCDALQLGVSNGMSLPSALELARDAVPSPKLNADSQQLIDTVNAGRSLELESNTTFLPPLVAASLQMGIEKNDLPAAAAMLAQMYEEQSEIRLAVLPRVLSPLLLMLTASCVGLAVMAMLMPLLAMIQTLTGPMK